MEEHVSLFSSDLLTLDPAPPRLAPDGFDLGLALPKKAGSLEPRLSPSRIRAPYTRQATLRTKKKVFT